MSRANDTLFLFDFGTEKDTYENEYESGYNNLFIYQSIFASDSNIQSVSVNCSIAGSSEDDVEYYGKNDSYSAKIESVPSSMSIDIEGNEKTDEIFTDVSSKRPLDKEIREKKFWSKNEDDLLLGYINKTQSKNWRLISEHMKTKSPQQCAYRYSKLLSDMNKKKWNRKDDIKLIELVETFGQTWDVIAREFGDRSERDVETRFKEKLDPNVKNTKFTETEDDEIVRLYEEYGSDWFRIARHFRNRNAKMIKKRFQTFLKFTCKKHKKSKAKSSFHNTSVSTASHSQVSTPRSSQGPVSRDSNAFNTDSFYNNIVVEEPDILSANYFKVDLLSPVSTQIENIDKYFSQICLFYTEKSLKLEHAIAKTNKSGLEISNILNINSQVSNEVQGLMNKVHVMHGERTTLMTEQACKMFIVRYIEIVLQIIQQIKIKLNLFHSL